MGYGFDIFVIRIASSGSFDMINDDFNYVALVIVVIGISIALWIVKKMTFKAKLYTHFNKWWINLNIV